MNKDLNRIHDFMYSDCFAILLVILFFVVAIGICFGFIWQYFRILGGK
jgi:ABC-type polysaccharide/polyol phosphate export permease